MLLKFKMSKRGKCRFATASVNVLAAVLAAMLLSACSPSGDGTAGQRQASPDRSQSGWRPVTSSLGHFKILMPGDPKQSSDTIPTARGEVKLTLLTSKIGGSVAYSMGDYQLPPGAQQAASGTPDWQFSVAGMSNQMMGNDGKLISERQFAAGGRDATELVLEKANGQAHVVVRIYPGESDFYVATVVMPNQIFVSPKNPGDPQTASNLMTHFFDSIEFTK